MAEYYSDDDEEINRVKALSLQEESDFTDAILLSLGVTNIQTCWHQEQKSQSIMDVITPFMSETKCDRNDVEHITKLRHYQLWKIMCLLFDQHDFINPKYEVYSIDYDGNNVGQFLGDIATVPNDVISNHVAFQSNGTQLIFNFYSVETFAEYLNFYSKHKFVFIPIAFGMEGITNDHQTMLCVDLQNNEAYFMDPNGKTSYFKSALISATNCETLIESLFEYYFFVLSTLGRCIKFIKRQQWNPDAIDINKGEGTASTTGNCVVMSFMAQYVNVTHLAPGIGYNEIQRLGHYKLCDCIDKFTKFISELSM